MGELADSYTAHNYGTWKIPWYINYSMDADTIKFRLNDWTSNPDTSIPDVPTLIVPSKFYVHEGSYTPEQLGIYRMPEVSWIHVGYCSLKQDEGQAGFGVSMAHAHTDEICISHGTYVFTEEGYVDDVLIHEYLHILAGETFDPLMPGHSETWRELMKIWGLYPTPYMTYVYK
jgi:hypothetical protein